MLVYQKQNTAKGNGEGKQALIGDASFRRFCRYGSELRLETFLRIEKRVARCGEPRPNFLRYGGREAEDSQDHLCVDHSMYLELPRPLDGVRHNFTNAHRDLDL